MTFLNLAGAVLLVVIGLSGGILAAAGLYALLVRLGVISRLIAYTKTSRFLAVYEDAMVLGALGGTLLTLYPVTCRGVNWLLLPSGLLFGIFTGCLAFALAETVQAAPVFFRRFQIKKGAAVVVTAYALGKFMGALLQLVL